MLKNQIRIIAFGIIKLKFYDFQFNNHKSPILLFLPLKSYNLTFMIHKATII